MPRNIPVIMHYRLVIICLLNMILKVCRTGDTRLCCCLCVLPLYYRKSRLTSICKLLFRVACVIVITNVTIEWFLSRLFCGIVDRTLFIIKSYTEYNKHTHTHTHTYSQTMSCGVMSLWGNGVRTEWSYGVALVG